MTVIHQVGLADDSGAQVCLRCGEVITEPGLGAFPPGSVEVISEPGGSITTPSTETPTCPVVIH
jgi:hypothetical protein